MRATGPIRKETCWVHCHMSGLQYGIFDVCRAWAHHTGVLVFDGRKIAARFKNMSKSTVYAAAKAFEEDGWFKLVRETSRRSNGKWSPRYYQLLTHEDWVLEHPGQCKSFDDGPGLVQDTPVQLEVTVDGSSPAEEPTCPTGVLASSCRGTELTPVTYPRTSPEAANRAFCTSGVSSLSGLNETAINAEYLANAQQTSVPVPARAVGDKDPRKPVTHTDAIQDLSAFIELKLGLQQDLILTAVERSILVSTPIVELKGIAAWALEHKYWSTKIAGPQALKTLLRSFPNPQGVRQQFLRSANQKRTAMTKQSRQKAASVVPDPKKPFNFAGEIL